MTHVLRMTRFRSLGAAAVALAGITAAMQFGPFSHAHAGTSASSSVRHRRCSLGTLKGAYVTQQSGWQVSVKPRGPFAFAATYVFDGHGHARGMSSRSLDGRISRYKFTVRYTLASDCAGTETLRDNTGAVRHYDIYVLPSGGQFTYLRTDRGIVGAGTGVRG